MKLDILFWDTNSHKLYQRKYGKPLQEHLLCFFDNIIMVMPCKWFRYKEVNALAQNVFDRLEIKLVMSDSPFSILFTNLNFESQTGICQTKNV